MRFSFRFLTVWAVRKQRIQKTLILSIFEQPRFSRIRPVRKQVDCGSATHHNRYGLPAGLRPRESTEAVLCYVLYIFMIQRVHVIKGEIMKKYMLAGLLAVVSVNVFAEEFTTHPEGDADFITFVNQQRQNWDENAVIISEGTRGDFLNYIDETPEILQIYNNKEKTAMFLSVENPAQYIKPGKCLVNTIGYDILKEMAGDNEVSNCSWRLFCGTEMNYDGYYAVELCGDMVSD